MSAAEIKTTLREKLTDRFKLVSPIRWTGIVFRAVPTIDVDNLETDYLYSCSPNVAGNDTYTVSAAAGEKLQLEYGRVWIDTDATAANRKLVLKLRNKNNTLNHAYWRNPTNITANQVKYVMLNRYDYTHTLQEFHSDVVGFFIIPNEILDEDYLEFSLENGVAGDQFNVNMRIKSIPIARSYEQ